MTIEGKKNTFIPQFDTSDISVAYFTEQNSCNKAKFT